jgi:HK97 family phage major capsid protein
MRAEGIALLTGSGVGRPQGVLTNGGIAEVVSGDATHITADGLLNLFYSLKTAYAVST